MPNLLSAHDVRVEYGELVAVGGISFDLSGGDLLGLIGPNGAGKTTLLRVLAGLQAPTAGSTTIMGHDVLRDSDDVRGKVGFAPDAPPAYEELTLEQFLYFVADMHGVSGREADERIDYWLEKVWLNEKRSIRISKLSRGMRQRITIAQTLIPNPAVVLLDEPSSGLDPRGRAQLREVIASLAAQGKAVIVSSHILADLEEYCTHIAIIEHGRLLRYAHVHELNHADAGRAAFRLSVMGEADVSKALLAVEGVSHVRRNGRAYVLDYHVGEESAALLLRTLIANGVSVTSFESVRENLEDFYLKTGVKQVD